MKDETKAKECGQRLRRVRMARNMSQEKLANLLFTSAQNISKYEKEGISNIDVIIKINEALDCNLLKDEMDEEGTIGEVGKEILCVLVEHNGFIEVPNLINFYMHGLAPEQVTKEIVKLEKIGLCVREQYIGHLKDEHDGLFITAKGLISLKNNLNPAIAAMLFADNDEKKSIWLKKNASVDEFAQIFIHRPEVMQTYEQLVHSQGYETYQDYIDSMELQRMIYELPLNTYRTNYIWYLKQNFTGYTWLGKSSLPTDLISVVENCDEFLSSENIYIDILHRMSQDLDNELLGQIFDSIEFDANCFGEPIEEGIREALILKYAPEYEEFRKTDKKKTYAIKHFMNISKWYKGFVGDNPYVIDYSSLDGDAYAKLDKTLFTDEDLELSMQYEKYLDEVDKEFYITDVLYDCRISDKAKDKDSKYITEWFTEEEIRKFVNLNMGPASNDEEKKIDEMIAEINRKYPETLEYYEFPEEWEENGLASLIRHNCNI